MPDFSCKKEGEVRIVRRSVMKLSEKEMNENKSIGGTEYGMVKN